MNTRLLTRTIRRFVLATSICALVPAASAATATWNGGTGLWQNAANWSPSVIPNNTGPTTYDVLIDGGNPLNSIVTLGGGVNISNLTIGGGDSLLIGNGAALTIVGGPGAGSILNAGTININTNFNTTTLLVSGGTVTLSGGGTVNFNNSVINRIVGAAATDRLINQDNLIQGGGTFGAGGFLLTNRGTITANQSTTMTLDFVGTSGAAAPGLINSGLMQAVSGRILLLNDDRVDNFEGATAGTIRADGAGSRVDVNSTLINGGTVETVGAGEIRLSGSTISGGTLTTSNGGIVNNNANSTLGGTVNNVAGGQINVTNNTTLTLLAGGTYANAGTINLNTFFNTTTLLVSGGTVTLSGGGTVNFNNSVINRIVGAAATDRLINQDNLIQGGGTFGADTMGLTNNGIINANQTTALTIDPSAGGAINGATGIWRGSNSGGLQLTDGTFTNNGTVEATSGGNVTFTGSATVTNYNAGTNTLTGGFWQVFAASPATITLTGASVQHNAAIVVLSGVSSNFPAINALNDNQGRFIIQGGRVFNTTGALANSGDLIIHSTLNVSGALAQSAGSTMLRGGALTATALNFNDGSFRGFGTATGPVTMSGGALLLPEGLLTINGSVTLGGGSMAGFGLRGTTRGTGYDALDITGALTFGGTLDVVLFGGFQPQCGNSFNLFDWGTKAGTFSTVNLPSLNPGLLWNQSNLYIDGTLSIALAPSSFTWDGGGTNANINTAANWNTDIAPPSDVANTYLFFDGTVRLTPNFGAPFSANSITFKNNAASNAFTFNGSTLTVGTGGIINNDADTQTISAAIALSANESFNAAAGDLSVTEVDLAAHILTLVGANDVTLGGASGTGTVKKENAGALNITGALGTGGVTLNAITGETYIGDDQTLAALNIGDGATVTLGALAPASASALQGVPEPGAIGLLAAGLLSLCSRRRRA